MITQCNSKFCKYHWRDRTKYFQRQLASSIEIRLASFILLSLAWSSSSKWWLLQNFFGENHFRNVYAAVNIKRNKNHTDDGKSLLGWQLKMGEIYFDVWNVWWERFTDFEMRQRQICRQVKQAKILCSKFLCQVYHQGLWSETQIYITLDTRQLISPASKLRNTENIFIIRDVKSIFIYSLEVYDATFEIKGRSL